MEVKLRGSWGSASRTTSSDRNFTLIEVSRMIP